MLYINRHYLYIYLSLPLSYPCLVNHLCQFSAKSVHYFSKYSVLKIGNKRTDGRGQPGGNIQSDWRRKLADLHVDHQSITENGSPIFIARQHIDARYYLFICLFDIDIAILSVRLPVSLSVTFRYSMETA